MVFTSLVEEGAAMKCEKCGFVSFDYLSECRRCGADLMATRERLGFSALKSEVPFLLGTLLKGGGTPEVPPVGVGGESGAPTWESPPSLESEPSINLEESPANLSVPSAAPTEAEPPAKEELIIELSEADLESLAGGKETPRGRVPRKNP